MRAERLSRHLYDVEAIMDTEYGQEALSDKDLYIDIVNHRKHLTKISEIDYKKHMPGSINLIPPVESIKKWESDYSNMQESMIYGESVSFKELINRMRELMTRINQLNFLVIRIPQSTIVTELDVISIGLVLTCTVNRN